MKILVTGTAGFIGFHLAGRLVQQGNIVVGLDSINDYYDVDLKYARLARHGITKESIAYNVLISSNTHPHYSFIKLQLEDQANLQQLFAREAFNVVIHLAAQAGVRYSLTNPYAYIESNITGFINILENARHFGIKHLVYASSSSVYGLNENIPFSTLQNVDHPISLYAATKKSNELMAHAYSYLFNIPSTGLRFFTVYGPWGRPDMALFLFTKAIIERKPVQVFNNGEMARDFTYVDDIVEGVIRVMNSPPSGNPGRDAGQFDPSSSKAPYKIYNIGNNAPVKLLDFIKAIEEELGIEAIKNMMPLQPGDVTVTYADTTGMFEDFGYKPATALKKGIKEFIEWYKHYYRIQ